MMEGKNCMYPNEEGHEGMDQEILAEIIELAHQLMGDKIGKKEPVAVKMEVAKGDEVDPEELEKHLEGKGLEKDEEEFPFK